MDTVSSPASDSLIFSLVIQAPEIPTPTLKELARRTGASRIVGVPGGGTQAFRLEGTSKWASTAAFCAEERFDFAFVPASQHLDRVRLVSMDMDSTLITIECVDDRPLYSAGELAGDDLQGIGYGVIETEALLQAFGEKAETA